MTFNAGKPDIDQTIGSDIPDIDESLTHLYNALLNEHPGLSVSSVLAKHVLGNRSYLGTINKTMTDADDAQTVVSGVGFEPSVILFFASFVTSTGEPSISLGGYVDGSMAYIVNYYRSGSAVWLSGNAANAALFVADDDIVYQAIDAIAANADGFTATWSKSGTPTGTAHIFYICFQ